jgi:4-methyl-5(b-hydroxyethyl)-thiazole monophosphate biosynthesis
MKIVVPLAEGFEEIEFATIVDILRRGGLSVTVAGLTPGPVMGGHGIPVLPDTGLERIKAADFDAIVLPGGHMGYTNLGQSETVLNLIQEMFRAGKYVTAICGAPSVLAKAGVLAGKRATIYPGMEDTLAGARCETGAVVTDGRIITSRGPGTTMPFALKLLETWAGRPKAEEVAAAVLAKL